MPIQSPHRVVKEARDLLGAPWQHQGRTALGIDCTGLVIVSALHAGWNPVDGMRVLHLNYRNTPNDDSLERALAKEGVRVPVDELRLADVVLFHLKPCPHPFHVGLVSQFVGDVPYVIHADATAKKVVEHALSGH